MKEDWEFELSLSCAHVEALPLGEKFEREMIGWLPMGTQGFVDKRKKEYLAGRYCAKKALKKQGLELKRLDPLPNRAPDWPSGVRGSISHNEKIAIAMVSTKARGLGVDCETIISQERFERIKKSVINEQEEKLLADLGSWGNTLAFSGKEALYKALHPLCLNYFDFLEATFLEAGDREFTLDLRSSRPNLSKLNGAYRGKFLVKENLVITWFELL